VNIFLGSTMANAALSSKQMLKQHRCSLLCSLYGLQDISCGHLPEHCVNNILIHKCTHTSPPHHHIIACPQIGNGGDSLQIWREAVNILNKHLQAAHKGWPASLRVGQELTSTPCKRN
jgi:hypothetical protein